MSRRVLELIGVSRAPPPAAAESLPAAGVLGRGTGRAGLVLLSVVLGFVLLVPALSGVDPLATDGPQLAPPSAAHPFGTDQGGRDVLVRVADGGLRSIAACLVVIGLAAAVGAAIGLTAAFGGRVLDAVAMRSVDVVNGIPPLIIPIAAVGVLGPSYPNLILAVTLAYAPSYARIVRNLAGTARSRADVQSARLFGIRTPRIVLGHILPSLASQLVVIITLDLGSVIVALASLSFLGFGAQAPTPEWGVLLDDGQTFYAAAPWLLVAPAALLVLLVTALSLLGEALRDGLEARDLR
ncbi:MAG: ABC transporter permease [Egibacteraceae bacterium]